jgi:hypothetical protein
MAPARIRGRPDAARRAPDSSIGFAAARLSVRDPVSRDVGATRETNRVTTVERIGAGR